MAIYHKIANGELTGNDALAEALTAQHQHVRIMARGSASGWMQGFLEWVNDEVNRPKASASEVMLAILRLQLQLFGSVAAQLTTESADRTIVDLYVEVANVELQKHLAAVRMEKFQ